MRWVRSTLAYPRPSTLSLVFCGVKTHSLAGFVLPDFRKRLLWDTGSPPYGPQPPPAELERGGDWCPIKVILIS
jgi:hypothetical protein